MPQINCNDIPVNRQGIRYDDYYEEPETSYDPYPRETIQTNKTIGSTERAKLKVSNFFVNLVVSTLIITILGVAITSFPLIAILVTTIALCILTRR
jgi:hypothetical protein